MRREDAEALLAFLALLVCLFVIVAAIWSASGW